MLNAPFVIYRNWLEIKFGHFIPNFLTRVQSSELSDGQQLRAFDRREGHDVDLQSPVGNLGQRRIQVDVFGR